MSVEDPSISSQHNIYENVTLNANNIIQGVTRKPSTQHILSHKKCLVKVLELNPFI